jgi:serine/threonine protein kinase
VHRDIKPSYIFLCDAHDGERTLKVLDFGVVRVLPDASEQAPEPLAVPTESGVLMGTPRYLSPEGAMGQRVDARADLYAAALMLYYMLTGRGPFDEIARDTAVLAAHAYMNPPAPSLLSRQAIRPELDAIILKALRKDPASRYQSALEFKTVLDRVAAMLVCPTALQETTVLGDLSAVGPVRTIEPSRSLNVGAALPTDTGVNRDVEPTKSDSRKPQSPIFVRAIALFVLFGLLMAAVIAWTERSP